MIQRLKHKFLVKRVMESSPPILVLRLKKLMSSKVKLV